MPTVSLGLGDFGSFNQNVPKFRTRNMYLTDNPVSVDNLSRVTRPTLTSFLDLPTGPVRGIWRSNGVLNNDFLVASGLFLYRYDGVISTVIAPLTGTGLVTFSAIAGRVLYLNEGRVFSIGNDGTVTQVVVPDSQQVSSISAINSYFILTIRDTQTYYYIPPGETDPDGLDFAAAERFPDDIVTSKVVGDEVWMLGVSSCEVLGPTGDADSPFARITGRVYNEGCLNADTAITLTLRSSPACVWVTDTYSVVLGQGSTQIISTTSEEELLREATNIKAWYFRHLRNDFYVLTSDQFTLVFDLTKGVWLRWDTYLLDNWRAHLGFQDKTGVYAGDAIEGKVWRLEEGETDDGTPILREVAGWVPNTGKPQPCYAMFAFVNAGWSTDFNLNPTLEMRYSDDLGSTWTDYFRASLGDRGNYSTKVFYRSLGLIRSPGRIFEFRCTDPVKIRIDYAVLNEE